MKVPMLHSYYDAIAAIALLRVVNSKTITLLFQDHTLRSHFIRKALSLKHIRKSTVQARVNSERKSLTLFSITWKGLEYVAQKDSGLYEILFHQPNLTLFSPMESKAAARAKLASVSNTIVIAYSAGANIPANTFGSIQTDTPENRDEDTDFCEENTPARTYTLRDFYRDYLDDGSLPVSTPFEDEHEFQDDDYMVFYERGAVKARLSQESDRGDIKDFQSGRYTGILESHFKTVMMYVAPMYTMPWSRWLVNAELNAYRMWGRTYSITDIRRQSENLTMAAVIVNNARDFAYHFHGTKRRKEKGEVFGGAFAHVYVISNDHTGIRFLNWLMQIDDKDIQREMAEMAVRTGNFKENDTLSAAQFVLRSQTGIETCVLLTMDAKQIMPVRYYAYSREEKEFQVICFDWQVDYLKRVLPSNVSYWPVSFSLIQE